MDESGDLIALCILKEFVDEGLSFYCSEHLWLLLFVQFSWQLIMFLFVITVFYFYLNSHLNHISYMFHFDFPN